MKEVDHQSPQTEMEDGEFVPELALSSVEDEKARKSNNNGRGKKTLGNHMRVHQDSPPKMNENDDSEMGDRKIQKCWVCGKSFSSLRSLCGHLRCHPERERRSMRPPEKNPPPSSLSNGSEGVDEKAYGAACGLMLLATGEERYKLSPNEEEKEEPMKSKKRKRNEVDRRRCREEEKRVVVLDVDLNEVALA